MSGIFVYPSNVTASVADLLAAVQATDVTVQNCAAIDTGTRASWGAFYMAVVGFCRLWDPSFPTGWFGLPSSMAQVEAYGKAVADWQDKFQKANCTPTSPRFDPTPKDPTVTDWNKVVSWAAIGAAAISTAYVVGKVVEFIPKPAPRRTSTLAR